MIRILPASILYAARLYEKDGVHRSVWQGSNFCYVLPDGELPKDSNSAIVYKTITDMKFADSHGRGSTASHATKEAIREGAP